MSRRVLAARLSRGLCSWRFDTFEDAYTEIFSFIECYYNSKRRHSALGYLCPDKFEELYFSNLIQCP